MPFSRGPSPCSGDHAWQAPQSLRLCFGTPFSEKLLLPKQADHNPSCNTNAYKPRPPATQSCSAASERCAGSAHGHLGSGQPPTARPRSTWLSSESPEKSLPLPPSACAPPRARVPHDKGSACGRSLSSEQIYEFLTLSFRDANGHVQPSYGQAGVRCPREAQRCDPDVSILNTPKHQGTEVIAGLHPTPPLAPPPTSIPSCSPEKRCLTWPQPVTQHCVPTFRW